MKLAKTFAALAALNAVNMSLANEFEVDQRSEFEVDQHPRGLDQRSRGLDLCINPDTITMTGNSAGGYFAHKMHILHSSIVKGVGILQGGPIVPELKPNEAI